MKISKDPLVSIISVNYNGTAVTCEMLRSLKKVNYSSLEVIIVDNGSKENPEKQIKEAYPEAKLIVSEKNLGFAGGNNLGVDVAMGELLFFVNNDTEFDPNIMQGLIEVFHEEQNIGMASPKFHYYFHPGVIEYAGYQDINMFNGRNGMVGSKEKDVGQYDEGGFTHYVHGGGMMVPKEVINKVGKMSEAFFLYYEELDWSERIKQHGYNIYYQPKSLIYHKESMTVGKASLLKTYYLSRNRILFMRRNFGGLKLMPFLFYLCCITIPKNVVTHTLKGDWGHAKAFLKGVFWNLTHFRIKGI